MRFCTFAIATALVLAISTQTRAWDGTDSVTGDAVEIEKGQLVRTGNDIEYYDYGTGDYKNATVDSITRSGLTVEIEVQDSETGESHTLEMDDR